MNWGLIYIKKIFLDSYLELSLKIFSNNVLTFTS